MSQETHTKEKKMTEIMTNFTAGDMLGTPKKKPSNPPKEKKKDKVTPVIVKDLPVEDEVKETPAEDTVSDEE
jgi:hypothetical protein